MKTRAGSADEGRHPTRPIGPRQEQPGRSLSLPRIDGTPYTGRFFGGVVALRIGINGLGRIGRGFLRLALGRDDLAVVAVNDLADPGTLAHLIRHDSLFGRIDREVSVDGSTLSAGDRMMRCLCAPSPAQIPWSEAGVDLVLEATGVFTSRAAASRHLGDPVPRSVI